MWASIQWGRDRPLSGIFIEIKGNLRRSETSSAQSESAAADDSVPAAGREVDVFFPHTDSEDFTCSELVIDQMSVLTHFLWAVGGKTQNM